MRKNIYAYTDPQCKHYPGYISINEEGPDAISIIVRSPEHNGVQSGTITLTKEQLAGLAVDLFKYLDGGAS